jgi:Choline/Carnitine o-acyltransferase
MFNIGRIPHEHCDSLSEVPPPSHPTCRSLLVMIHDWCYTVDVYSEDVKLLDVADIERYIRSVVEDANTRLEKGERAVPVGVLSADHRDLWAKVILKFTIVHPKITTTDLRTFDIYADSQTRIAKTIV